jgi:hypothetical protein
MPAKTLFAIAGLIFASAHLAFARPDNETLLPDDETVGRTALKSVSICHGQYERKTVIFDPFNTRVPHGCDDHPGFLYEACYGSTGGGADPRISAVTHCGPGKPYTGVRNFPPISGDQCGYSWFTITCWSGD